MSEWAPRSAAGRLLEQTRSRNREREIIMKATVIAGASMALAALALATSASADDRPATAAERGEIEAVLKANGFTSWRKIEFDRDDRKFEVDDAVHSNGRVHDVDIRGGRIVKKELD
jgi:hypothetical protein